MPGIFGVNIKPRETNLNLMKSLLNMMQRLLLVLILTILFQGCSLNRTVCPSFPIPNAHVKQILDDLSAKDREVWAWGNQLRVLCIQLGTCKE